MAHRREYGSLKDTGALGGLEYSRRLFEIHGRAFLARMGLLDVCSLAFVGGTSQNAAMDDAASRDRMWGPYLTILLADSAWRLHGRRLKRALPGFPDRVDDVWQGYDGPEPRRTDAHEIYRFLHGLTGYRTPPQCDVDLAALPEHAQFPRPALVRAPFRCRPRRGLSRPE